MPGLEEEQPRRGLCKCQLTLWDEGMLLECLWWSSRGGQRQSVLKFKCRRKQGEQIKWHALWLLSELSTVEFLTLSPERSGQVISTASSMLLVCMG